MKRSSKHYTVVAHSGEQNRIVCFSLDSTRPDAYMPALEKDLLALAYRGEVLLDLLAANGEGSRRFMRLSFDGGRLNWLSAKIAPRSSIDSETLSFCGNFYATHPSSLAKSVLSAASKHRIKSSLLSAA